MNKDNDWLKFFREQYPEGFRIKLRELARPNGQLPAKSMGTLVQIGDDCRCHVLWDCVNLNSSTVLINKQLQEVRQTGGEYQLLPTKNRKGRSITLAPFVIAMLHQVKMRQLANRLRYGECYEDSGFVFTDELGHHLSPQAVYRDFKKVVTDIGCPDTRSHDLRTPTL